MNIIQLNINKITNLLYTRVSKIEIKISIAIIFIFVNLLDNKNKTLTNIILVSNYEFNHIFSSSILFLYFIKVSFFNLNILNIVLFNSITISSKQR